MTRNTLAASLKREHEYRQRTAGKDHRGGWHVGTLDQDTNCSACYESDVPRHVEWTHVCAGVGCAMPTREEFLERNILAAGELMRAVAQMNLRDHAVEAERRAQLEARFEEEAAA